MIGQITAGDHVDIFIGFSVQGAGGTQPVIKLLMADVLVLRAPCREEAGSSRFARPSTGPLSLRSQPTTASSGSSCGLQAERGPSTQGSSTLRRF